MDWDSARVHSGLGPGTAVKCFILPYHTILYRLSEMLHFMSYKQLCSKATGTLLCTSMTFLNA